MSGTDKLGGIKIDGWITGKLQNDCPWDIARLQVRQTGDAINGKNNNWKGELNSEDYLQEIDELSNEILELNDLNGPDGAAKFDAMAQEQTKNVVLPLRYAADEIKEELKAATDAFNKAQSDFSSASDSDSDYSEKKEALEKAKAKISELNEQYKEKESQIEKETNDIQSKIKELEKDTKKGHEERIEFLKQQIQNLEDMKKAAEEAAKAAEEAAKAAENKAADGGNVGETEVRTDTDVDKTSVEEGSNTFNEESENKENGDSTDNVKAISITDDDNYAMKPDGTFTKINGKEVASREIKDGKIIYKDSNGDEICRSTSTTVMPAIRDSGGTETITFTDSNGNKIPYEVTISKSGNGTVYDAKTTKYANGNPTESMEKEFDCDDANSPILVRSIKTEYNENGTNRTKVYTDYDNEGIVESTTTYTYDENGKETQAVEIDAKGKKTVTTPATITRNGEEIEVYKIEKYKNKDDEKAEATICKSKDYLTTYNDEGLIISTRNEDMQEELKQEWANATADYIYSLMWDNKVSDTDHGSELIDIFFTSDGNSLGNNVPTMSADDFNKIKDAFDERYGAKYSEVGEVTFDRTLQRLVDDCGYGQEYIDRFNSYGDKNKNKKSDMEIGEADVASRINNAYVNAAISCDYGDDINERVLYNVIADLKPQYANWLTIILSDKGNKVDEKYINAFNDAIDMTKNAEGLYNKETNNLLYGKDMENDKYKEYVDNLITLAKIIHMEEDVDILEGQNLNNKEKCDLETVYNTLYPNGDTYSDICDDTSLKTSSISRDALADTEDDKNAGTVILAYDEILRQQYDSLDKFNDYIDMFIGASRLSDSEILKLGIDANALEGKLNKFINNKRYSKGPNNPTDVRHLERARDAIMTRVKNVQSRNKI